MTVEPVAGRRQGQRRRSSTREMSANAMRCSDCGTIWYSRLAEQLVAWTPCARCTGQLHTERREGDERRQQPWSAGRPEPVPEARLIGRY